MPEGWEDREPQWILQHFYHQPRRLVYMSGCVCVACVCVHEVCVCVHGSVCVSMCTYLSTYVYVCACACQHGADRLAPESRVGNHTSLPYGIIDRAVTKRPLLHSSILIQHSTSHSSNAGVYPKTLSSYESQQH